jgi:outer membrane protein OmpA-like peptidoglycan-associated protein
MKMRLLFCLLLACSSRSFAQQDTSVVYFDFDKWDLTPAARTSLDDFVSRSLDKKIPLTIKGHCDAKGSDAYNDVLSEKRVASVKSYLLEKGMDPSLIILSRGYGEKEPLNNNRTDEERKVNRRVELIWPLQNVSTTTPVVETPSEQVKLSQKIDTVKEGENITLRNINFYGGRHTFLPQALDPLNELLEVMKTHPALVIEIQGHICCFRGTEDGMDYDANDRRLSVNRARAVYEYLADNGIEKERMSYKGYAGTRRLVEEEMTEADRTLNRRVEIRIVKK